MHDNKKIAEIDLWHKWIGHVNIHKLKNMQSHGLVIGLPRFVGKNMQHVCEACQYGKQVRLSFEKESVRSTHALQLIHTDVWGRQKKHQLEVIDIMLHSLMILKGKFGFILWIILLFQDVQKSSWKGV